VKRRLDDEKLDMDSVNRTKKKNKQSILVASGQYGIGLNSWAQSRIDSAS
jgi:hypothetical protein